MWFIHVGLEPTQHWKRVDARGEQVLQEVPIPASPRVRAVEGTELQGTLVEAAEAAGDWGAAPSVGAASAA